MGLKKLAKKFTLGSSVFHKYLTVKQFNDAVDQILEEDNTMAGAQVFEGGVSIEGGLTLGGGTITTKNIGAAATNVTAIEYGTSVDHTTILSFTNLNIGTVTATGNEAFGSSIYTFPDGVQIVSSVYMGFSLTGTPAISADTPEVGLGETVASGASAVLGGTAAFENFFTGTAVADCSGTASRIFSTTQEGTLAGDSKTVYFNVADGWADAGVVTATGTIVINWKHLG